MKIPFQIILIAIILVACKTAKPTKEAEKWITTASGLKYYDIVVGSGETPKFKQKVTVNFILTTEDGIEIENTYKSGIPMSFLFGNKDAIEGLEEGVATMRVGGRRKLWIPPELGFGSRPYRNVPANSNLIMEVELVKVE